MEILSWPMDPALKQELREHCQTMLVPQMKNLPPLEIIRAYTFSYGAPNLSLEEIYAFMQYVEKISGVPLEGVGLEVGAGPGTHAALLAKHPNVKKVYGVEGAEGMVLDLMPVVVPFILGADEKKVVGVVGDFSQLDLLDSSVDFAFDFFSLHHSPDLNLTLSEIRRVLKPGGVLVCYDKARDDRLTNADLERMLDTEYNADFKKKTGIPVEQKHTRRMNGEHEYRRRDWMAAFSKAGFSRAEHFNIARTKSGNPAVALAKRAFALLPPRLQAMITDRLPLSPTSNISPRNRIYSPLINNYQKEISLLIAHV